jgi:hypothetical protein
VLQVERLTGRQVVVGVDQHDLVNHRRALQREGRRAADDSAPSYDHRFHVVLSIVEMLSRVERTMSFVYPAIDAIT